MVRLYGHRWTSGLGDCDDGTWLMGLSGLSPEDIANGYKRLLQSAREWPPSMPEFREMCLGITETEKDEWIEHAAMLGLDTFDQARLTYAEIDKLKKINREKGLQMCLENKLQIVIGKNLNQKRLTSELP